MGCVVPQLSECLLNFGARKHACQVPEIEARNDIDFVRRRNGDVHGIGQRFAAMRYNDVVKDLALRLKAKGLKGKAIIGAAMHKLAHLIYGVLKTQTPYRADWAKNANPKEVSPQEPAPA